MSILEERLQQVKYYIPDENLRHIIFNFDDEDPQFLSDDKVCLQYFSNAMTFAMITVWNIFLSWKKNAGELIPDGSNSFWRIYNMLDKTCDPTKINGEFIDDLLLNLEIDWLVDTEDSQNFLETIGITDFFHFNIYNNKLSKYIYMVKQGRLHSRNVGACFGFDALCECLKLFHFLSFTKITFYPSGIYLNHTPQNDISGIVAEFRNQSTMIKKINYNHTVFASPFETYYVEDFQPTDARHFDEKHEKNQSVILNYAQIGGRGRIAVTLMNEEVEDISDKYVIVRDAVIENFFLDCDIINVFRNGKEGAFFRDYILLNNKYLKNLSYTISDSLNSKIRSEIVRHYIEKYKDIFEKMYVTSLYNNKEIVGYRWDEIVLFLLLEEGVYEFLRFLLNYNSYDVIKDAFKRRFGRDAIRSICQGNDFLVNPEYKLAPGASDNAKNDCYAKALIVLATKLFNQAEWDIEGSVYPTTIDSIIAECERVHRLSGLKRGKIVFYSNILLRTLSFITQFYLGVFQYSRCKMDAIIDLNSTGFYHSDYQRFKEAKEQWIEEIKVTLAKSKEVYNKVISNSYSETTIAERIIENFNNLISLNDEYSSFHDGYNEVLFETTGKQRLFDSKKMMSFCDSICQLVMDSKHEEENNLFNQVKSFFMYLKTGLDEKERMETKGDKLTVESAIFPIVGQYSSGTTSVDGYKYSVFKVLSLGDDDSISSLRIKMITEDEFDFGCYYYCVPNINRIANFIGNTSFDKIWVSPIVIPCSVYLPPSIPHLEKLSKERDFDDAAELIYGSDEIAYKKLFGSLNNAKKVLHYLFNNPLSKFYKNHYYLLRQNNKIVAIASLYEYNDFSWDSDIIKKAFGDAHIELPSTFEDAIIGIKGVFNDYPGTMYYHIDDVCVKENERRHGIGSSIVMYLIKISEAQGKSVRLSVYSKNKIARHLYGNLGFVPLSYEDSDGRSNLKYIRMIRI